MLADALVAAGHQVTWWVSGFNHRTKQDRVDECTTLQVSERFRICLVPTSSYSQNISLARIRAEGGYASGMLKWAEHEVAPDVVLLAEPSLFFRRAALETVERTGALLLLDTLDLWPEMFDIALPKWLQSYGRLIFAPLYALRARTYRHARGIIAASRNYLDLSKSWAPHLPDDRLHVVYFGVQLDAFRESMDSPKTVPSVCSAPKYSNEIRLIFASTLGNNYDVSTVLDAAAQLTREGVSFRLFIAGTGPLESAITERIKLDESRNVHFLGNPPADEMARIYSRCDIGISAYVAGSRVTMPIKGFHYCAAGLAVVNSLDGEFRDLLTDTGAGLQYHPGDSTGLATAIMQYARDPALLASARTASFKLGDRLDAARQYSRAVELVERVVAARASGAEEQGTCADP